MPNFSDVRDFHEKFQLPAPPAPRFIPGNANRFIMTELPWRLIDIEKKLQADRLPGDVFYGRVQMMIEELRELVQAHQAGNLADQADALVDLAYFVFGTAVMMGLPWEELFTEVHTANMGKILVESPEESKRLNKLDVKKPAGWQPPNLARILARYRELHG